MEKDKKRCCETCVFYEDNGDGVMICTDYEGLYFQWEMYPNEKCPDYKEREKIKS